jgi:hypothetical protein
MRERCDAAHTAESWRKNGQRSFWFVMAGRMTGVHEASASAA